MITWIANRIMSRRAIRLFQRIRPHLPDSGVIADIGSGTGHNGEALRERAGLQVLEFDVDDLHWVGPAPSRIVNGRIPADDDSVDAALLLFVLQYPANAPQVLREAARVSSGSVIVLQSTHEGRFAKGVLKVREFFFGRFGFFLARVAGLVPARSCPLMPERYFTSAGLMQAFDDAGLAVVATEPESMPFIRLRRELFVLRPGREANECRIRNSPSSSRLAMKSG
ncbi:MAG: hypothetical protein R3C19_11755 [Planctomycetaceae bacterium]